MAAIMKCKMCGGDLLLTEGSTIAECEYCGTQQTVPTMDNDKKLIQFERADRLRRNCEFDKAAGVYESIVADFRQEAEAYWGLVLCKYGIEYVDDPATGKKVPTCHRSSFESVMDDPNFDLTMENADALALQIYRKEAKQIEEIRKGIIEVSSKEDPYDVFICYKETDASGNRTVDSLIAQDIYDALTDKGYRVFFSRISLEDKLGSAYEPHIFAALNSAKIMLAVGTAYAHYNAVWVKNEWSRYLKLMETDKNKHLIPCFKDIDAYDIPKEFKHLQAQDMGKVGAMQDLCRGIEKILSTKEKKQKAVVSEGMTKEERIAFEALKKGQRRTRCFISVAILGIIAFFVAYILVEEDVFHIFNGKNIVCYSELAGWSLSLRDFHFTGMPTLCPIMIPVLAITGLSISIAYGFRNGVTAWYYHILFILISVFLIGLQIYGITLGPVLWILLAAFGILALLTILIAYFDKPKALLWRILSLLVLPALTYFFSML